METIPIFIKVKERRVLVVGGTPTALERLDFLKNAGAKVTFLLRPSDETIFDFTDYPDVVFRFEAFSEKHLDGMVLVFAAAVDPKLNQKVSHAAQQRNIPVNAFDVQEDSTFNMPAIVDRDPLVVAISSDGNSPTLAGLIRLEIEKLLPQNLGEFTRVFGTFRPIVQKIFETFEGRKQFWRRFLATQGLGHLTRKTVRETRFSLFEALENNNFTPEKGKVYLVGAGPGDPELLTLKACHILGRADVIFYDRLVNPKILKVFKNGAKTICVGKTPNTKGITQEEINEKIVESAKRGDHVVRLKSGDPLIFGRAREELRACYEAGVEVEIIPGITAALATAARAQIPLTQREGSSAFTIITGRLKDGNDQDFSGLAGEGRTLAIYMGVSKAGEIQRRLLEQNLPATTPISIVASATLPEERIVFGFLLDLESMVKEHQIQAPAIIFVGNTIAEVMNLPLQGNATRGLPLSRVATAALGAKP